MTHAEKPWDTAYEWKAVLLLALGFGLVGLDRFIILPLFPAMMKDLHLNYQDLGLIASVFSIAWGASALVTGNISDRIGRRKTLIPAVLIFSFLAGGSGLATSLISLLFIRVLMGVSEGGYTPASIAATIEASKPSRRGFNLGLQQQSLAVFGLALGPILATQLLTVVPSWRWVFVIISLPGIILAVVMYFILRDTQGTLTVSDTSGHGHGAIGKGIVWRDIFRHRNVALNAAGMCCMLSCFVITTTMVPSYLTDVLKIDLAHMGFIMSGIGFGGFAGQMLLPGLSDRVGRRPIVLGCYAGTFLCIALLMLVGAQPVILFALLFGFSFFNNSMICLNVGPLTSESSLPHLTSTATGVVVGIGEIVGGGVAPVLAGMVALHFGLGFTFYLALGGLAIGLLLAFNLKETAPLIVARSAPVSA